MNWNNVMLKISYDWIVSCCSYELVWWTHWNGLYLISRDYFFCFEGYLVFSNLISDVKLYKLFLILLYLRLYVDTNSYFTRKLSSEYSRCPLVLFICRSQTVEMARLWMVWPVIGVFKCIFILSIIVIINIIIKRDA